jgi:hypothetical protein
VRHFRAIATCCSFAAQAHSRSFAAQDNLRSFAAQDHLLSFAAQDHLRSFAAQDHLPRLVILTFSCPSGGMRQTAAISRTASNITCGNVGFIDLK